MERNLHYTVGIDQAAGVGLRAVSIVMLVISVVFGCRAADPELVAQGAEVEVKESDFVEPRWNTLSVGSMTAHSAAGRNVYTLLSSHVPTRSCPIAVQYIRGLAGGRELSDLKRSDFAELSVLQSFWLSTIYLMEHSATDEGVRWASAVWREIGTLPKDCRFEIALCNAGRGSLLKALFYGSEVISASKFSGLLAPFCPIDPAESVMSTLWDYFTLYGSDVDSGPIVRLDHFSAGLDLDPSSKANWRKTARSQSLLVEFQTWKLEDKWRFVMSAESCRKRSDAEFNQIRESILGGAAALAPNVFDE